MVDLFVYSILLVVGYDMWSDYSTTLDSLFMEDPNNTDLLELELMQQKDAILHTLFLMDSYNIDISIFGKLLMREIKKIYRNSNDLSKFSQKMYEIWNRLPATIENGMEPFFTLNYAGDCLAYGDEKQCRKLFEEAMNYYG